MSVATAIRYYRDRERKRSGGPATARIVHAADFVTGEPAAFARAADRRGVRLATYHLDAAETREAFLERARSESAKLGASYLVIGGLPQIGDRESLDLAVAPASSLPPGAIVMPDPVLHTGQIRALRVVQANRFAALRCGRRFGKSGLLATIAADTALLGGACGIFVPTFRLGGPIFDLLLSALRPLAELSNRSTGELRLKGGGSVDIWSLEHPRAGRGRRYNVVGVDEAAHAGDDLMSIWSAAIRPTLADLQGSAIAASTPNGVSEQNFFWAICNQPAFGFVEHHAETAENPFIPPAELEELRRQHNPLVFAQEFLAQFVDLAGVGLFNVAAMLANGVAWDAPERIEYVFAVIDSGMRGGTEHDASAVVYFGMEPYYQPPRCWVLDWQAVELGAGDLEAWFRGVLEKLKGYGSRARRGMGRVFVECQGLGELLLAKGQPIAVEIPSKIVARGKDLRALAAERHINGGRVRLTREAYDKTMPLNGVVRNHLVAQTAGFRIGDKDAWKRSDDLVDALVYGALLGFEPNE